MAIYVGENKAILLKGDRNVAELYKGGTKIFGYSDTVSGEMLNINDAHPVEHKIKCSVRSKNLLQPKDVGAYIFNPNTDGTYDILDDGGIYIQSLSNTGTTVKNADPTPYCSYTITESDTYTVSVTGLIGKKLYVVVCIKNDSGLTYRYIGNTSPSVSTCSLTLTEGNVLTFYLQAAAGAEIEEAIMYVQLEKGTTSTDYTSYISDFSGVTVTRCGKNFADMQKFLDRGYELLEDGSYYKSTTNAAFTLWNNTTGYTGNIYVSGSFKWSSIKADGTASTAVGSVFLITYTDGSRWYIQPWSAYDTWNILQKTEVNQRFAADGVYVKRIEHAYGTGLTPSYVKDLMITLSEDSEFEEYKGEIYTPTADGTVEGITSLSPNMTLMTNTKGVVIECEYVKG